MSSALARPHELEAEAVAAGARGPLPWLDPYLAGVGVGAALLLAFALAGRGLGASGAFDAAVVAGARAVAPDGGAALPYVAAADPTPFLADWLVLELLGVVAGALASAALARRLRLGVERTGGGGSRTRLLQAFGGGVLMAIGARLARGCTSGLGLTGGATLSVGAWLFVVAAFAAAFAVAPLVRRRT